MRNITRVGDGEGTAWQVAIKRSSPLRRYYKMFSDSRFLGDAEAALAAAQAWRDAIEQRYPKQTRRDRFMRPGKNNASGKTGVYRIVAPRRHGRRPDELYACWLAETPAWVTPCRSRSFSVAKYGDEEAFRRAVAARRQFERDAEAAVDVPISPKAIGRKPPELRCILRLQRACGAVWRVSISRGTPARRFRKHFPDQDYGGAAQALAAAQAWRAEIERQHPRPSRSQLAKGLNTRNTSGKAGVSRTAKPSRHVDGSATVTDYWLAKSPRGLKPARSRIFSVSKHGEQEAYRLAVEARLAFEAMLDEQEL
jgi:hypothetical protein